MCHQFRCNRSLPCESQMKAAEAFNTNMGGASELYTVAGKVRHCQASSRATERGAEEPTAITTAPAPCACTPATCLTIVVPGNDAQQARQDSDRPAVPGGEEAFKTECRCWCPSCVPIHIPPQRTFSVCLIFLHFDTHTQHAHVLYPHFKVCDPKQNCPEKKNWQKMCGNGGLSDLKDGCYKRVLQLRTLLSGAPDNSGHPVG